MSDSLGVETPLTIQTAAQVSRRIAAGEISAADLNEACLARISARDPQVHAWAWHDPAQVRAQVAELPPDPKGKPLYGVPIGVKDIIETSAMPTAYGSRAYAGHHPGADAVIVARLKAAGAIIMGKTVTTEFAYLHPGPTTNPHNPLYTPGGSSSGSAAAVADTMVPLALGSQTGGSTIRPSAFCGIVGFKPTYGQVPLEGVLPLSPSMDTIGLHARAVEDVALLYPVLLGRAVDAVQIDAPLRIFWHPGPVAAEAGPDAWRALESARRVMQEAGIIFVDDALPAEALRAAGEANRSIMAYEAGHYHQAVFEASPELLGEPTRHMIATGLAMSRDAYEEALGIAATARDALIRGMADVDALLSFSAPGEAPLATSGTGSSAFNRIWTTIGAPCLTLPFGRGAHGLPIGVQLVSANGQDARLLAIGARVENILKAQVAG